MKYKKKIIAFLFLISILLNIFPKLSVSQPSDIVYTFNENLLYSENSQDTNLFNNSYNMKNKSVYTNFYNATHDFNKEVVGTNGSDIDFVNIDNSVGNTLITINDSIALHNNILELRDNDVANNILMINFFGSIVLDITIDFWFRTTDFSKRTSIDFRLDDTSIIFNLRFDSFKIDQFNGTIFNDIIIGLSSNIWYHISIETKDSLNTFDFSFNSVFIGNFDYWNNSTIGFNNIQISSRDSDLDYSSYFDAIGYSFGKSEQIYDFTDDTVGQEPNGWISDNTLGATTEIIANLDGRINVLDIHDTLFSIARISTEFNLSTEQNLEFEFTKSIIIANFEGNIILSENSISIIILRFANNDLFATGVQTIKENFLLADTFDKYFVDFNHSNSCYDIYINDILEGNNIPYLNNVSVGIDNFNIQTKEAIDDNYHLYLDNIFFNNEQYIIGSNIIPFLDISNTIKEVDKYQFDLKTDDFTELRDTGSNQFGNWNEIDDGGNNVQIASNGVNDREVVIASVDTSFFYGIEKTINKFANIINVSWSIRFSQWDFGAMNTSLILTSMDNIIISDIEFKNPSIKSNGIILQSGLGINEEYICNLYINFLDGISILRFGNTTSFFNRFFIPIQNLDNHSLGKIIFKTKPAGGETIIVFIDNIGIYIEGNSFNEEVGYLDTNVVNNLQWAIIVHNLITFNGNGSISFYAKAITKDTLFVLRTLTSYSELITFNVFEKMWLVFPLPHLRLYSFNEVIINSIKISGVKANDGSIDRIPFYTHSGIDFELNYFFVDTSNRLNFIHESDDTSVEFMTADFDFFSTSFSSNNRTVLYQSSKNNIAIGFFIVNFSDTTSNILEIPSFTRTTSAILTQQKIVESFQIIITDNDIDSIIGITTGWISKITFGFGANFNITVATLSLILMIVPILIILLPTILIGGRLGKNFIIPIFFLMSLLTAITSLIPIWLFFIIALSSIVFITKKRSEI